MARKTNKTAHVLNLISKAKDEHQSTEEQMQIDNTGSDVSNDLLFMGIEPSNDKSISEKITENLEALANQMEEAEPLPGDGSIQPETISEAPLQNSTASVNDVPQETPPVEKALEQAPLVSEVTPPDTALPSNEVSIAALPLSETSQLLEPNSTAENLEKLKIEEEIKKTFHYVNVYEKLVLERLEEFQTMFEVCTCPRCTADVIALALSHLPAKYIVIDDPKVIPLLSFYRASLRTSIATQLSSACTMVREKPLHHV